MDYCNLYKTFKGVAISVLVMLIFFSQGKGDEMVQSQIMPSALQMPGLASTLVIQNQQKNDAKALEQIASVMEQALAKHDAAHKPVRSKVQSADKTGNKKKEKKGLKSGGAQDLQQAMLTEFLRTSEFTRSITIKTAKIGIRDALLVVAKQAGINLLVDHDIQGDLPSLRAYGLPASAVLQMIMDAHKPPLSLLRIGGAWRAIPKPRAEELLRIIVEGEMAADRVMERIGIYRATWDEKLKESVQALWQGIVGDIKEKTETYLVFDDAANQLFVCGRKAQVKRFKECLSALDMPAPQIRLEMRVICAGKNFESDLGMQWSGLYDRRSWAGKFGLAGFGIGEIKPVMTSKFDGFVSSDTNRLPLLEPISTAQDTGLFKNLLGWTLNAIPANLVTKAAAAAVNFPITFGGRNLEWGRLNLQLMAAEQNSEIKTILKPTLLVNNLETAEILVGQQLPHKVNVQETVQGNVVNAASTFYKDVGTKLQVKPTAMAAAGQVVLDIFLEHSYVANLQQSALTAANGKDDRGNYTYVVESARTKNKVVLKSGQTTMIGGLMVNTYEQAESGIPFLKDIPGIGVLFRGRSKVVADKQLLIFITPTLIDCSSAVEPQEPSSSLKTSEQV